MNEKWFEVWGDLGLTPPYLLLVIPGDEAAGTIVVLDPQKDQSRVFQSHSYEDVKLWLLEDEYERLTERMDLP